MGIYGKGGRATLRFPEFPELGKKEGVLLVGGILLLIILLALAIALADSFQPQPIHARFTDNPLDLAHAQNTFMVVRVFNAGQETVQNAVLSAQPVSPETLIVFPASNTIRSFGPGEFREFIFTVRPNPQGRISSGSYTIKLTFALGQKQYEHAAVLQIKAVT